jgi:hydrogenase small subunit
MATVAPLLHRAPDVKEIHVVWMTTGLGCDGDSVSITAASLPSIEDLVMGAIPGLPKVYVHNPVIAYENGDDFLKFWYQAAAGKLDPFVLVMEGSIPNEKIKKEGYWAALGTDSRTGQPITTNEWIDRLAPKALGIVCAGTCATYGLSRLSWLELALKSRAADRERPWLSGPTR